MNATKKAKKKSEGIMQAGRQINRREGNGMEAMTNEESNWLKIKAEFGSLLL